MTNLELEVSDNQIKRAYSKFINHKKHFVDKSHQYDDYWRRSEFAYSILGNNNSRFLFNKWGPSFLNYTDFSVMGYLSDEELDMKTKMMGQLLPEVKYFGGILFYPIEFDLEDFFFGATKTIRSSNIEMCVCPGKKRTCQKCQNEPYTDRETEFVFNLPEGAPEFHRVIAPELWDSPGLRAPAFTVFVATSKKHPVFERKGRDLHMNFTVSIENCLSDEYLTIIGIDGTDIKIPTKYAQNNTKYIVQGQGFTDFLKPNDRGDLIVNYVIKMPEALNDEEKQKIASILPEDDSFYL